MAKQIVPIQMFMSAAGDSAANIDVPADGDIVGYSIEMSVSASDALGDGGQMEVSFGSSNQFTTNDARNVIGQIHSFFGDIQTAENNQDTVRNSISFHGDGIPVSAGERIHLHGQVFGGSTWYRGYVVLYFRFAGTLRIRRR